MAAAHRILRVVYRVGVPVPRAPLYCVCGWVGFVATWDLHRGQTQRQILMRSIHATYISRRRER